MTQDTAIVAYVTVPDRHTNIEHYILAAFVVDELCQHLPGVQECISLEEVVETAIAGDLKLGSYS